MLPDQSTLAHATRSSLPHCLGWLMLLISLMMYNDYLKNRRFCHFSLLHFAGALALVIYRYVKQKLHSFSTHE